MTIPPAESAESHMACPPSSALPLIAENERLRGLLRDVHNKFYLKPSEKKHRRDLRLLIEDAIGQG